MSEYNDKKNQPQMLEAQDEINSDPRNVEYQNAEYFESRARYFKSLDQEEHSKSLDIEERFFRLNAKKQLRWLLLSWMAVLAIVFVSAIVLGVYIMVIGIDEQTKPEVVKILIGFCIFLTSNLFIVVTTFGTVITSKTKSAEGNITSDTVKQAMEILKPFLDIIKSIRS